MVSAPHRVIVIAKLRQFNDEIWKELLMAMAYYLHEQRLAQTTKHYYYPKTNIQATS